MVNKYLLRIILLILIPVLSVGALKAQDETRTYMSEQEIQEYFAQWRIKNGIVLKGLSGKISSLDSAYCSQGGYFDLVPDSWDPIADNIEWEILFFNGNPEGESHPEWGEYFGEGENTIFRVYPDLIPEEYLGLEIFFTYSLKKGPSLVVGGAFDYTYIHKTPTVFDFGSDVEICQGASVELTLAESESGMEYQLIKDGSIPQGLPISGNEEGSAINFTVNEAGTYTVQAVNIHYNTCSSDMNGSAVVVVNPLPIPMASSDSPTYCEGGDINLEAAPDDMISYNWVYPNGATSNVQNPIIYDINRSEHHGSYSLTVEDEKGCVNSTSLNLTVFERPTAEISGSQTICDGATANLTIEFTGEAPFSVTYTDGHTPTTVNNILSSPYPFGVTPSSTTTYTLVDVSDANGCGILAGDISGEAIVTVNERPTATIISSDATICNGDVYELTIELSGEGSWELTYNDGIGNEYEETISSSPHTITLHPTETSTYSLVALSDKNCSAQPGDLTGNAVVTVNERPTSIISVNGADELCDGQSTTIRIDFTGQAPWNFVYEISDSEGSSTVPLITTTDNSYEFIVNPSLSTTYEVISLTDALCEALPADMTGLAEVDVHPRPTAVLSGDADICDGTSTQLMIEFTGTGPWNVEYEVENVSDGTSSVTSTSISENPSYITVYPTEETKYRLLSLSDALCSADPLSDLSGEVTVTILERPTATIYIADSDNDEICASESTFLTVDLTGTGPWSFIISDGEVEISDIKNTFDNPYKHFITPEQTKTYNISYLEDANCVALPAGLSGSATVNVNPRPTAELTIQSGSDDICDGEAVVLALELTGSAPFDVSYTVNDGLPTHLYNIIESSITFDVSPHIDSEFKVISVTDNNGCSTLESDIDNNAYITVNKRPKAQISIDPLDAVICEGQSTNLLIELEGEAPWNITIDDGNGNSLSETTNDSYFILSVSPEQNSNYTVTALTDANCTALDVDLTDNAAVTVNERPTSVISVLGADELCDGQSTTIRIDFTGQAPWNFVYRISDSDGSSTDSDVENTNNYYEFPVSPSLSTTYEVISLTDALCEALSADMTELAEVAVNPRPTAELSVSGDAEICDGGSTQLMIEFSGTAPWEVVYEESTTSGEPEIKGLSDIWDPIIYFDVNPTEDTDYKLISLSDANNCIADPSSDLSEEVTVTVFERPSATIISLDAIICDGDAYELIVDLSGEGPWTLTYNDGNGNDEQETINSSPHTITLHPAETVTYSLVALSDVNCAADISKGDLIGQVEVTVNARPTATLTGTNEICVGGDTDLELLLTGASPWNIEYTINDGSVEDDIILSSPYIWNVSPIETSEYKIVSVSDANGCSALESEISNDALITVYDIPDVEISINDPFNEDFCYEEEIIITAVPDGYLSYIFSIDGNDYNNGNNNVLTLNDLPEGEYEVSVTIFDSHCYGVSLPESFKVNPLPSTDLILDDPLRTTVCINETVEFIASGADEYQLIVNGETYGTRTADPQFFVTMDESYVAYVIGYNFDGCSKLSDEISITVSQVQANLTISPNKPEYCANETLVFTASGGENYEFFYNGVSQGSGEENVFELYPPIDLDEVYVIVTDEFSCTAISDLISLTVNPVPVVSLTSDKEDETICEGEEVTYIATEDDSFSYKFFRLRGVDDVLLQEGSLNSFTTNDIEDGDEIYVVVRDAKGCNGISPSIVMTVYPNPDVSLSVLPSSHVSEGQTVTLEASGDGLEFLFHINSEPIVDGWITDNTYEYENPQDGDEVFVIARSDKGCTTVSETIQILVDALPLVFNVLPEDPYYCADVSGVQLYLDAYEENVKYDLFEISDLITPYASAVVESGVIVWNNIPKGSYRVKATRLSGVEPTIWYPEDIIVIEMPLPSVYLVEPNETVDTCPVLISLNGSEIDMESGEAIIYTLYRDGIPLSGYSLEGTGEGLIFDEFDLVGYYTVWAENPETGCRLMMDGAVNLDLPPSGDLYDLYTDPADGEYCEGGEGVGLYLQESTAEVNYQLYYGGDLLIDVLGDGKAVDLGNFSEEGLYQVFIEVGNGCRYPMSEAQITINPLPALLTVDADNGGHFCEGSPGVQIRLNSPEIDVVYELWRDGEDNSIDFLIGDGEDVQEFLGFYNEEDRYYIIGTTDKGCSREVGEIILVQDLLPNIYDIYSIPDGGYCEGESAVIIVDGSQNNVKYELLLEGAPLDPAYELFGNGGQLTFGDINVEGYYTVLATDVESGCSRLLSEDGIFIKEIPLPDTNLDIDLSGGIENCDPIIITVNNPEPDVYYELVKVIEGEYISTGNSFVSEDGSAESFEGVVDNDAYYNILAINNGCEVYIFDDVDDYLYVDVPGSMILFYVTGDADLCEGDGGGTIGLSGSEPGAKYYLRNSLTDETIEEVTGDGEPISFDEVYSEGSYYVWGDNDVCPQAMIGVFELRFHPLPSSFTLLGFDSYCGVDPVVFNLENSEGNIDYTLYRRDSESGFKVAVETIQGSSTGEGIYFTSVLEAGYYTVIGKTEYGCTSSMYGEIILETKALPSSDFNAVYYPDYCDTDGGTLIGLDNSESEVTYQLINNSDDSVISNIYGNDGSAIDFAYVSAGSYRIEASYNGACRVLLEDNIVINEILAPSAFDLDLNVENVCGDDALIKVENPEPGVSYYLVNYDALEEDLKVEDSEITFNGSNEVLWDKNFLADHSLTENTFLNVWAESENGCIRKFVDAFIVNVLPEPAPFVLSDNQGNLIQDNDLLGICVGSGLQFGIEAPEEGTLYSLIYEGVELSLIQGGEEDEFKEFPVNITQSGNYSVLASFIGSGCEREINFIIDTKVQPDIITLLHTAEDACVLSDTLWIAANELQAGVNYNLYSDSYAVEELVGGMDESGNMYWIIDNNVTNKETYSFYVIASFINDDPSDCISFSDILELTFEPTIAAFNIDEFETDYCEGEPGISISLSGTQPGIYYEIVRLGEFSAGPVESVEIIRGDESGTINFKYNLTGTRTGMDYQVVAHGDCVASIHDPFTIIEHRTPYKFDVEGEGAAGDVHIELSGSETGVWYYLLHEGDFADDIDAMAGTGSALNFGTVNLPGNYSILAIDNIGACENLMEGTAYIYEHDLKAYPDTLYMGPKDLIGTMDLLELVEYLPGVDIPGVEGNLVFQHYTDHEPIGDVDIDPLTGMLSYRKLPTYFGMDSIRYSVRNVDIENRADVSYIIVMIGNKDLVEDKSFLVPNAFSPNGDGYNDYFVISGLGTTEESSLEVFNRWGTIVYRNKGKRYNNDWDGTSNTGDMVSIGDELPVGVYFYIFKVKKNIDGRIVTREYSGFVELRR